jgi:hypothetical protein
MPAAWGVWSGGLILTELSRAGFALDQRRRLIAMLYFAHRMWSELLPFLPGPPLE